MSANSGQGFTLLELLVTLGIIGILTAIAIPSYVNYRTQAKIAQAKSDLRNIATGIEQLANDTREWPGHQTIGKINTGANNELWDLSATKAGLMATDGLFPNWQGPYLRSSFRKDPWGMNYFLDSDYRVGGTDVVALGSFGPNKCCQNGYDSDDVILILPTQ
jgi:type II secretion system protein G